MIVRHFFGVVDEIFCWGEVGVDLDRHAPSNRLPVHLKRRGGLCQKKREGFPWFWLDRRHTSPVRSLWFFQIYGETMCIKYATSKKWGYNIYIYIDIYIYVTPNVFFVCVCVLVVGTFCSKNPATKFTTSLVVCVFSVCVFKSVCGFFSLPSRVIQILLSFVLLR